MSRITRKVKHIDKLTLLTEEIKQLYNKNTRLNTILYQLHLELINMRHPLIMPSVMSILRNALQQSHYRIVHKHDKELTTLTSNQHNDIATDCTFYNHISNLTDIVFDSVELKLLNKGFKYNLNT